MLAELLKPIIGKKRMQKLWMKMYALSLKGMNIGLGGDFETSGELIALNTILNKKNDITVVFDVGANIGMYSNNVIKKVAGENPNFRIHAFEPCNATYETLCKNVTDQRVIKNKFALGEKTQIGSIYFDKENSGLASLFQRQLLSENKELKYKEEISIVTLDSYCAEKQIEHIDFLKMDVEGNEYNVLLGAQKMLSGGEIDAIQIEFGGCNLDSRIFMRDFWLMLKDRYNFYRILRDGLYQYESYNELMEIFTCRNYLFIKK